MGLPRALSTPNSLSRSLALSPLVEYLARGRIELFFHSHRCPWLGLRHVGSGESGRWERIRQGRGHGSEDPEDLLDRVGDVGADGEGGGEGTCGWCLMGEGRADEVDRGGRQGLRGGQEGGNSRFVVLSVLEKEGVDAVLLLVDQVAFHVEEDCHQPVGAGGNWGATGKGKRRRMNKLHRVSRLQHALRCQGNALPSLPF